jgi:hypothetical protein
MPGATKLQAQATVGLNMQTLWQYRFFGFRRLEAAPERFHTDEDIQLLQQIGSEGWELTSTKYIPKNDQYDQDTLMMFFKKSIEGGLQIH